MAASTAAAAIAAYSLSSIIMVILNKKLVSEYSFKLPTALLIYQNSCAVLALMTMKRLGAVTFDNFSWNTARKWLPVNVSFVSMLTTGFFSLQYLTVPMVTIFKNMSNILTVAGEFYFLGEPTTYETVGSLFLIVVSSVYGGANDLAFNATGYFWMALNCVMTATYLLYMRYASTSVKLCRHGCVFYNNILSVPILFVVMLINGEWMLLPDVISSGALTADFVLMATLSGLVGFSLSFTSFWCVGATSATTYAVVGAMNKIPLTVASVWIFGDVLSLQAAGAVLISLLGGLLYSYSKIRQKNGLARVISPPYYRPVSTNDTKSPTQLANAGVGSGGGIQMVTLSQGSSPR